MSNSIIYSAHGSRDKFTASLMVDVRKEMNIKLASFRKDQAELVASIAVKFDNDQYRKLSIVNHRIEVAESRLKGEWLRGSFPQIAELSKSK